MKPDRRFVFSGLFFASASQLLGAGIARASGRSVTLRDKHGLFTVAERERRDDAPAIVESLAPGLVVAVGGAPLTTLVNVGLLLARQQAGGANASMSAMGDQCGIPAQASADCRQPLPPATAAGPESPKSTPAPQGCGPALLDPGMSLVTCLAHVFAHRETRNRPALASPRLAHVLALAFKTQREHGPKSNSAGATGSHRAHGHREPPLGSAEDPSGARQAWAQRPTHGRPSPGWRPFLKQHASVIWACDFFCIQTIFFRTLYVYFVIHHASRQVLHVHVTPHRALNGRHSRWWNAAPGTGSRHAFSFMTATDFTAQALIGGRAISVSHRLAHRSDRLGPTRSPSDG
jgi:hypothetical protein